MLRDPKELDADQLRAMIRIHRSTADVAMQNNEGAMAADFRELAQKYLAELERRGHDLYDESHETEPPEEL